MNKNPTSRSRIAEDNQILASFLERRRIFDAYLKENSINLCSCPSCGYPTLSERGGYEICSICEWEDDEQDDENADDVLGGPNANLSLTESRINIERTLRELAEAQHSSINISPEEVLKILSLREKKIDFVRKRIKMDTPKSSSLWDELQQIKKETLIELIKR